MAILVFSISAFLVLWVLFGYPLALHLLASRFARPIHKSEWMPEVSVLLAVRNGERYLRAKLDTLLALDYPPERMRILVLSDGSTDATAAIARAYSDRGVELLELAAGGKCNALNAGLRAATGEVLFYTDVRQDLAPGSLRELTACLADPQVAVVSGELIIRDAETEESANVGLYWRYEKWIRKNLSRLDSIHGATGCIYAMKREYAAALPADALLDDMHQPLAAFFQGKRIVFEERARAYDYPTDLDAEFKRKVRTLAGNYQIMRAYPRLLGPSNRMLLHFVSHKVGRLVMPFALIALLISCVFLPYPWNWIFLGGQIAFYLAAGLDRWLPESFPLKRFTSPARVFVVLMAASLCAASILFVPGRRFWTETRAS